MVGGCLCDPLSFHFNLALSEIDSVLNRHWELPEASGSSSEHHHPGLAFIRSFQELSFFRGALGNQMFSGAHPRSERRSLVQHPFEQCKHRTAPASVMTRSRSIALDQGRTHSRRTANARVARLFI